MHQTHFELFLHRAADRSGTDAFHTVWPRLHYAVGADTRAKRNCCFAGPKWRHSKWNSPFITKGYRALAALHRHFAGLCWVLNGFWVPFWAMGILCSVQASNTKFPKFPLNVLRVGQDEGRRKACCKCRRSPVWNKLKMWYLEHI